MVQIQLDDADKTIINLENEAHLERFRKLHGEQGYKVLDAKAKTNADNARTNNKDNQEASK